MGFTLVLLSICTNIVIFLLLLLWCSCCMSFVHSPDSSNGTDDQLALLAFKARITHDPFHVLRSWNDSVSYCDWTGVICGGRRNPNMVKALHLSSRGLEGLMAPEIGNLSFLREIRLENNSFYGEIPCEVSFLSRLRYLFLHNNSFQGEIPPNISRCSDLILLSLGRNNFVGKIPVEYGTLSKLRFLSVHENKLMGQIPPSFGNLSSLNTLYAGRNGLTGSIPDSLGRLTRLMSLYLGANYLSGTIPPTIYNLSSLGAFHILFNQFQGTLPPNLGFSLPNLWRFSFSRNQFHGPIPISVSNLSKLEKFYAGENNLNGKVDIHFGSLSKLTELSLEYNQLGSGEADDLRFINTLTNCSNLVRLWLAYNQFGGVIPNSIQNMSTQLRELHLAANQISGRIPIGMGNLVNLIVLSLFRNLLEGSIPTSFGKLQKLNGLYVSSNGLIGPIPSSLGNLTQLVELYLGNNRLHGKIPSSLGRCKNLLRLGLSNNSLSGTIPQEIFDLSTLIMLNLSRNYFFGPLPSEVGRLTNVGILRVSDNMFSGEIPSTLGTCIALEHLFMEGNLFQGSIPSSLSSLRALVDLDISRNKLSGFIPKYLGTFADLKNLNLSFNHLEGEVPTKGVFRNLSEISLIGNNMLCGGIPELHLLACQTQKAKKYGRDFKRMIVTICTCGVSLCLIFMSCFFIIYWRRKEKKEFTPVFIGDHYFKVSYGQLFKATDGFSSSNLIGVGSFGSVFKGVFNHGETIVAVKVFNFEQRGASKSFMAECEALRNIRHRNLVKILTSCSSVDFKGNDFKALIYEFMPGGNLERWLHPLVNDVQDERRNLNFVQRLNIAIDIAAALDYLHHHCYTQIIHCDIKPSNILLDDDLIAHLGDFGVSRILSKITGRSQNQTSSIGIKGSIGYIAPGANVSTYGDVYSYGILLLEMFTRKQPTDEMFKDNLNLHCWAEMALHDGVMAIVDPSLLSMVEVEEETATISNITESEKCMKDEMQKYLHLLIRVGVTCSAESPCDRMDMNEVIKKLYLIKDIYPGIIDIHQEK